MDQDQGSVGAPLEGAQPAASPQSGGDQPSPRELREDIEKTREEMGDTVEALAAKTDVKARAEAKVSEAKAGVAERRDEVVGKVREATPQSAIQGAGQVAGAARRKPVPTAAAGAFAGGVLIGYLLGRRS